jgi:hypothetical protein
MRTGCIILQKSTSLVSSYIIKIYSLIISVSTKEYMQRQVLVYLYKVKNRSTYGNIFAPESSNFAKALGRTIGKAFLQQVT